MASKTYILCPGQGAQIVGMGKDFYEKSPAARQVFDRANAVLGFDLSAICFAGPEDRLNQTDISQPAIYVTSVACHAAAVEAKMIDPAAPAEFAGLSLGEYTALHLAGSFGFETGLKLVAARGRYMQEAATANPSSMVAVMGADDVAVERLCEESRGAGVLVPANYNSPGQIVVSGSIDACQRFTEKASTAGFKAIPLKVAGAFHSPLMQAGADRMQAELQQAAIERPQQTVWANVTAQPHTDPAAIRSLLVDQIVKPVRWAQTMTTLNSAAADARWIELAPGRVLTGLLKKVNRRAPVESLATAEALTPATV